MSSCLACLHIPRSLRERVCAFALVALACLSIPGGARAGSVVLDESVTGGNNLQLSVVSFKELKFRRTLKQEADFSCGSAALATLLTYHYNHPVAERSILTDMISHGNPAVIQARGFSMLDMKEYLERQGIQSGGFRLSVEKIATVRVPGIVLINHNGYNHFAVLDGLSDGRVLLADPSLGTRAMDLATFRKEWNGILFLILNGADDAQKGFNRRDEWATQPRASWDQTRLILDLTRPGWRDGRLF